jgi:hypothetical protein
VARASGREKRATPAGGSRAHGRSNYNCCELRLASALLFWERAEIAPPFVSLRRLIIYLFSPAPRASHVCSLGFLRRGGKGVQLHKINRREMHLFSSTKLFSTRRPTLFPIGADWVWWNARDWFASSANGGAPGSWYFIQQTNYCPNRWELSSPRLSNNVPVSVVIFHSETWLPGKCVCWGCGKRVSPKLLPAWVHCGQTKTRDATRAEKINIKHTHDSLMGGSLAETGTDN